MSNLYLELIIIAIKNLINLHFIISKQIYIISEQIYIISEQIYIISKQIYIISEQIYNKEWISTFFNF